MAAATIGIGLPLLLIPYLRYKGTEYVASNQRVILKTGFISRKSYETKLEKIESISVNQGVFGRMFDYGTITVHGTGGSSPEFSFVADPLTFKRLIEESAHNAAQAKKA